MGDLSVCLSTLCLLGVGTHGCIIVSRPYTQHTSTNRTSTEEADATGCAITLWGFSQQHLLYLGAVVVPWSNGILSAASLDSGIPTGFHWRIWFLEFCSSIVCQQSSIAAATTKFPPMASLVLLQEYFDEPQSDGG